jgi:glycosyltransferase involved in cell wall biosynthesis
MIEVSNSPSPFFTVITVCLNAGKLLERTITSVLSQQFDSFEYVVKDGLSSDGSLGILSRIEKVKVISKADTGIYDAMNQALSECRGEYVSFMNAGDTFYSSDTLNRVADFIRKHPANNIYYGHAISEGRPRVHPRRLSMAFLYEGHLCHQALFVKRDLYINEKGFDLSYKLLADRDFLMRVLWVRGISNMLMPFFVCHYDLSGLTARHENQEIKRRELQTIQNLYFRGTHKLWIWFYLNALVKPWSLLRGYVGCRVPKKTSTWGGSPPDSPDQSLPRMRS